MTGIECERAARVYQQFVRATYRITFDNQAGSCIAMLGPRRRIADSEATEFGHLAEQSSRGAIEGAAKTAQCEAHHKVDRGGASQTALSLPAFSLDVPAREMPRLRRRKPDGSDTCKSVQRSAWALTDGIYVGIRNRFNHEDYKDIDEQTALEYVPALSVFARWVDDAEVQTAP